MQTLASRVTGASATLVRRSALALLLATWIGGGLRAQELPELNLEHPIVPADYEAGTVVGSAVEGDIVVDGFGGCDSCGSADCGGCQVPGYACPPGLGLWIRADYLRMWEKDGDVIPLITTSLGVPADPTRLLTLDAAETRVVFGGEVNGDDVDGWRLEIGTWLDATATTGIMARYFESEERQYNFATSNDEFGFLGVPFFDDASDTEEAFNVVVPNELVGDVSVDITGQVDGFELLVRRIAQTGCNYRMDWLYGYRNFNLKEGLNLQANNLDVGSGLNPVGTTIFFNDDFQVDNEFHGFDLGLTGHSHQGMWSMDFLVKVAFGSMNHEVAVAGSQTSTVPPNISFGNVGGLFSQESNIGRHDESDFAVIPEINVNIGYALTSNLDFTFGYTWIYASDVVRVGQSIDRVVHSGFFGDLNPNSDRPGVVFDTSSYWLQALNFGITGRF